MKLKFQLGLPTRYHSHKCVQQTYIRGMQRRKLKQIKWKIMYNYILQENVISECIDFQCEVGLKH